MNSILTTLDAISVPYTIIGAPKPEGGREGPALSVVLLNRGSRLYRGEALDELERVGLGAVLSIESRPDSLDLLTDRHPGARFLILSRPASPGLQIDLGMRESPGRFVFVLWSDMALSAQGLSSRFFERLDERDMLCQAPALFAKGGEQLPSAISPAFSRSPASSRAGLKVLGLVPAKDGAKSLFPYDYAGIYSREKFVLSGGFDPILSNPYWQKLDFGFRAWLWGEEIRVAQALKVSYAEEPAAEDESADECYKWFWLKNLAPSFHGDSGAVSASRFWSYLRSRRGGALSALGEFRAAREWVRTNRYRFRTDATSLVDLWDE
jgi:hypothetical protein